MQNKQRDFKLKIEPHCFTLQSDNFPKKAKREKF